MPKTNNQSPKKFLSLAHSWAKVAKFWLSKSIFYVKKYPNISKKISLKKMILGAHFLFDIFWKLQFLNHFIS